MALPPRVFFTLYETSVRWDCSIADIAGWSAVGKLKIKTGIGLVRCGDVLVAGQVCVSAGKTGSVAYLVIGAAFGARFRHVLQGIAEEHAFE